MYQGFYGLLRHIESLRNLRVRKPLDRGETKGGALFIGQFGEGSFHSAGTPPCIDPVVGARSDVCERRCAVLVRTSVDGAVAGTPQLVRNEVRREAWAS